VFGTTTLWRLESLVPRIPSRQHLVTRFISLLVSLACAHLLISCQIAQYGISDDVKDKHRRSDPRLGIPIAVAPTHEKFRPIRESPEERFGFAKTWLSECVASHEHCNADIAKYALPRRLLDISDNDKICLVLTEDNKLPPGIPYVALSYCWGKDGGNLCTYTTHDGNPDYFPPSDYQGRSCRLQTTRANLSLGRCIVYYPGRPGR